MKILLKIGSFSGGAPLSVLQYGEILKKNDCNVYVEGNAKVDTIAHSFIDREIPVIYSNDLAILYANNKFIKLVSALFKMYDDVASGMVDTVVSINPINNFFYSYICSCLKIDHLIIVAGGDFRNYVKTVKHWSSNNVICFSQENKEVILNGGYPEKKIKVISNRITCIEDNNWLTHYFEVSKSSPIILLITSRLDDGKTDSVKATMELTKSLYLNDLNVILKIAGNGTNFNEIKELSQEINKEVKKEIICLLGHVDDMKAEFNQAHFVFGKGRSVLEPIMMNRIGFVVGEDGVFSLCDENSIDNLYHYNFAGRHISNSTSKEEIMNLIKKVQNNTLDFDNMYENFENIRGRYHFDHLESKFYPEFRKNYIKIKHEKKVSERKHIHKIVLFLAVITYYRLLYSEKIKKKLLGRVKNERILYST